MTNNSDTAPGAIETAFPPDAPAKAAPKHQNNGQPTRRLPPLPVKTGEVEAALDKVKGYSIGAHETLLKWITYLEGVAGIR